ncbi:MAG TPA: hypothetical protein VFQ43_03400, partial [Nitrososphaera sp.]|nr:hypothetical protein [Nitrososphaera sp.]
LRKSELEGRSSTYFQHFFFDARTKKLKISFRSCVLSTSGSQWSAKGNETILRPLSQLLTRQKTTPFVKLAVGGEVV